ncbi:ComF family protein [Candidatus Laterigemmans baculatus]|uniref:ComF family protein n=1 Tax=Candidatus Laterigemmans baculatus TaxID=2770505 RepID=UPI00193F9461|nr:phosphoribosyltransferase family protein [Candidatus Laterigemmans baculatus]
MFPRPRPPRLDLRQFRPLHRNLVAPSSSTLNPPQGSIAAAGEPTESRLARIALWRESCVATSQFLLRGLSEICYPPTCVLCHGPLRGGAISRTLCVDCCAALCATAAEFACDRCSRPQPPLSPTSDSPAADSPAADSPAADSPASTVLASTVLAAESRPLRLCAACGKRKSAIQRSVALGMYRDVMREAVVAAKRLSFQPLTLALGGLLGQRVLEAWGSLAIGAVTFIPSHWKRRWGRRGCPAQLLARQVGRVLEVPVVPLLRSRRSTAKQGTLGDAERRKNVCGAFRAKKGYALLAPRVLVVDDVWTTGATLEEAARVIRQEYAAEIFAAVLARALGTHDG